MEGPPKKYPVPHAGLVIALMALIVVFGFLTVKISSPDYRPPITGFATIPATCGNNTLEAWAGEQCDHEDDLNCPGRCNVDCTCQGEERRSKYGELSRNTFYFVNVPANTTAKFAVDKLNISFSGAEFSVPLKQENFRIIVDTNITPHFPQPDGVNLQFFEIQLMNISDKNITTANITFRVFNDWINEKKIDVKSVRLMRLPDQRSAISDWQALDTKKSADGLNYLQFYAELPYLHGVFAINSYKIANCGDGVCDLGETRTSCCTDCSCDVGSGCVNNTCIAVECGNSIINEGETSTTCCLDTGCPASYTCQHNECQLTAGCGDKQCGADESVASCPQDCAKPTLLNPMFIFIIIGLASVGVVIAAVVFGIKFTFGAQKKLKKHQQLLLAMVGNEDQLRAFIKQNLVTTPLTELRKKLVEAGWERTLIDKILEDMRPSVSEILPRGMTFEKYVRKLLTNKTIDEAKAELQLKGWPMHQIDSVIKTVALEKLAERFLMNKTPYSSEKFHRFVKATKLLGYSYDAIKTVLLDNGWEERLVLPELGKYFT
jgi:PGF-pre-PGF domain-containing protein